MAKKKKESVKRPDKPTVIDLGKSTRPSAAELRTIRRGDSKGKGELENLLGRGISGAEERAASREADRKAAEKQEARMNVVRERNAVVNEQALPREARQTVADRSRPATSFYHEDKEKSKGGWTHEFSPSELAEKPEAEKLKAISDHTGNFIHHAANAKSSRKSRALMETHREAVHRLIGTLKNKRVPTGASVPCSTPFCTRTTEKKGARSCGEAGGTCNIPGLPN